MTDSRTLLADYAENGSEPAFRELVERYLGLVYSTALRLVDGDVHLAEDVAQTVFTDLARKARDLSSDVMLGGWLHQRTFHVAAPMMRARRRREFREREATQVHALRDDSDAELARVEPLLDEAITQLDPDDRAAIILRFFERRDFRSVGAALGIKEDAARMRVNRALDKLHLLLEHRGACLSTTALAAVLTGETLTAAPAGLAASVAGIALAKAAVAGGASSSFFGLLTMTKLQTAIVGVLVVAGLTTSMLIQRQAQLRLRAENESLRRQIAQLQADRPPASTPAPQTQTARAVSLNTDRLRELLRLRNEVGLLRRRQREIEQAAAAARSTSPPQPDSASRSPESTLNRPAPFQVQLVVDESGEDSESITNSSNGQTLQVQKAPLLDHTAIKVATATTDPSTGASEIQVEFSDLGKELFAEITRQNVNKRLAVVLDGHLYAAPVIRTEIPSGKAQVTGSFTEEEARMLAAKINEAIGGR